MSDVSSQQPGSLLRKLDRWPSSMAIGALVAALGWYVDRLLQSQGLTLPLWLAVPPLAAVAWARLRRYAGLLAADAASFVAFAERNGFRYRARAQGALQLRYDLALVRRARDGVGIRHFCHGRLRQLEIRLFQCRPTREDHGLKWGMRPRCEVLVLGTQPFELPRFTLLPNSFGNRLWVGWLRCSGALDRVHTVRGRYLLYGAPEVVLRRLFDRRVVSLLEVRPDLAIEGRGRELVCYRRSDLGSPDRVQRLLRDGLTFRRLALRNLAAGRPPDRT